MPPSLAIPSLVSLSLSTCEHILSTTPPSSAWRHRGDGHASLSGMEVRRRVRLPLRCGCEEETEASLSLSLSLPLVISLIISSPSLCGSMGV